MSGLTAATRLAGVIGWPVAHSLSPAMHNAEMRRLGLDWAYVAWAVRPERLEAAVRGLAALGVAGVNVTVPHKQAVMALMDEVSPEARLVGAVNTVRFDDGRMTGHNTDAAGWMADVARDVDLRGKAVFLLGAGGAARAVAVGACQAGARELVIGARRMHAAEEVAEAVQPAFPHTRVLFTALADAASLPLLEGCEVVVNATPVGMQHSPGIPVPADWLLPDQFVYDTIYAPAETALLAAARERGCQTRNGLGMLARQGAAALEIWTGSQPDPASMEETLVRLTSLPR